MKYQEYVDYFSRLRKNIRYYTSIGVFTADESARLNDILYCALVRTLNESEVDYEKKKDEVSS